MADEPKVGGGGEPDQVGPPKDPGAPAMNAEAGHAPAPRSRRYFMVLSLTALGVVFGDIATSPLYAVREAFFGPFGVTPSDANILGVLSLIFWALLLVISVKYLGFILRADNHGEGGILALMAVVHPEEGPAWSRSRLPLMGKRLMLVLLGLFGASLLYGDGIITPAISVLSAVEGLRIVTPVFEPFVIPITVGILIGFFLVQRHGTGRVGAVFGPVTLLWLIVLAILGIRGIMLEPTVLAALNPAHAIGFVAHNGLAGFFVLGAVFLVVTGGEALYADMGHFGKRPIRTAWFVLVLPALLLNYFGQGALLIANPAAADNPFYRLAPGWALIPLVVLATMATIIASQAVVSGAFSLTMQAIQMGYLPRLRVSHTSSKEIGQVYVSRVNAALMIASVSLVIGFGSSSRLAAAYGIAVSTDMVITTILFALVAREFWKWSIPVVAGLTALFLVVDLAFFGANILKVLEGGWVPLLVALVMFTLMTTWRTGRKTLSERLEERKVTFDGFLEGIRGSPPHRVLGTAVYLTRTPDVAPPAMMANMQHNHVLHERVMALSFINQRIPHVSAAKRLQVIDRGVGVLSVVASYGFMEEPNVPQILAQLKELGHDFPLESTTFFLGREHLIASSSRSRMALWREKLFALMARNAEQPSAYFHIPPDRVIEVGSQVEL